MIYIYISYDRNRNKKHTKLETKTKRVVFFCYFRKGNLINFECKQKKSELYKDIFFVCLNFYVLYLNAMFLVWCCC